MRARLAAITLLLACACAPVLDERKVDGWPALAMREHYVSHVEMRDRCTRYASFGGMTQACAEYDFGKGTCDIWYSTEFPPSREIVEHERLHCQGYDHLGSDYMRRLVARWNRLTRRD